jgi:hypothetical protein
MRTLRLTPSLASAATTLALLGCGGGADVLGNAPTISNPEVVAGQYLSFAYFQRCINPIFLAQLPVQLGGSTSTNTCAGSGCHDTKAGTGGALRVFPGAQALDLSDPANTPAVIRASDMYKNFYSAQAAAVIGSTAQSRLLSKPLLRGVLHGGGLIFLSEDDPNAKLISYWISRPMPLGQDELSTAGDSMFTPPDPKTGNCNTP